MAFTCGFFNSQNGDRKYNAEQMASIFDGLIKDGVYDTVGDIFAVTPGTGMQVLVGSGRAWFDHTWNNNDAQYPLAITAADVSLPRYDAVVLETNHSDTVRTNRLRVLTGTPASNPVKPTMTSTANVKQHPLAYIKVTAGATAITQSMIQVVVGTSECPFVTGIIDTAQIDALFQQWNGEFNEWFENLKAQLSDNVVANLQGQIDQKVAKADVATKADIEAGTSTTKWVTPKGLRESKSKVYDLTLNTNGTIETIKNSGCVYPELIHPQPYDSNGNLPIVPLRSNHYLVPANVNRAGECQLTAYILDSNFNIIKKQVLASSTNTAFYSHSLKSPMVGEYAGGIVAFSTSNENGDEYFAVYYGHRDILGYIFTSQTNYDYSDVKAGETDDMCFLYMPRYSSSSGTGTIYYTFADQPESNNITSWNTRNLSKSIDRFLGAHGTKIYYAEATGLNRTMTVYEYDVATGTSNQVFTYYLSNALNFERLVFEYPNAYFLIYDANTHKPYSKVLRVNVADKTTNIEEVRASSFMGEAVHTSDANACFLGLDDDYYYCGPGFIRINKNTLSVDIITYDFSISGGGNYSSRQVFKDVEYRNYILSAFSNVSLYKISFQDIYNPIQYIFPYLTLLTNLNNLMSMPYNFGYSDSSYDGTIIYNKYYKGMFSTKYPTIRCFLKGE